MRITTVTNRTRAIATAIAIVASVPALSGTAIAAPAELDAPYARAAAEVTRDGTLLAATNVESSRKITTTVGLYCVKVSDPRIDLASAVVMGTLNSGNGTMSITVDKRPTVPCGNDPATITVYTGGPSTSRADAGFTVAVL
ncbi:hypothetical protein ACWGHM_40840 [Streptomyces sp. NPDC054904]